MMDLSVFQSYQKPKTGFCSHYKSLVSNGRVLVFFERKGSVTFFTRIWHNQFGGGGGKKRVLVRQLPIFGTFTLPIETYKKMVDSSIVYDRSKNYDSDYPI